MSWGYEYALDSKLSLQNVIQHVLSMRMQLKKKSTPFQTLKRCMHLIVFHCLLASYNAIKVEYMHVTSCTLCTVNII